jgi:AmmeMemoRadiSam system protein B/AmmeMemoRadiSam system protein A
MGFIREAAVAGRFYPGNARELTAAVEGYLAEARPTPGPVPKAIIAPHAGYVYSGPVAATAYARLRPARGKIARVVLLGPCHRVPVLGLALSSAEAYATPLGTVPIDQAAAAAIRDLPQVQVFDDTHAFEHSLEVHLPFLQVVLGSFTLVPLVVGDASAEQVAQAIERLWGGPETLIVVSSDLSHYLTYDQARAIDAKTCRAIETLDPAAIGRDQACGRIPVSGLLTLARRRGLKVATVDVRNSGDTAGDKSRVVGYGSWVFVEEDGTAGVRREPVTVQVKVQGRAAGTSDFGARTRALLDCHGPALLRLGAASIEHGLAHGRPLPVEAQEHAPELREPGACFVTLKKEGRLRGCIGSLQAHRPLVVDVADNGFRAAFRDPRFPGLAADERAGLDLSLSVLSPSSPMTFAGEDDLLAQLRPGTDGLIIADSGRRALFLPSVWEQIREPAAFLKHLKLKAGLAADHWSKGFQAFRFVTQEIAARDLPGAPLWSAGAA